VDTKLVTMVKNLEQEAERIIQEAAAKAAEDKSASMEETDSQIRKIKAEALAQAEAIESETAGALNKELAAAQRRFTSILEEKIQQANSKMKRSVQFILSKLTGI